MGRAARPAEGGRGDGASGRSSGPVIHPLLFAAFPVLYVFAQNLSEGVTLGHILRPLALSIAATLVVFAVAATAMRSAARGGIVASALVLLFFSFGSAQRGLGGATTAEGPGGSPTALLALWAVLALGAVLVAARIRRSLPEVTTILNVVAAGLVILNVGSVVAFEVSSRDRGTLGLGEAWRAEQVPVSDWTKQVRSDPETARSFPDIYYIVFDTYAGGHVLAGEFGLDNRPFLSALEERGFYVAHRATANYPRTSLSLSSSLNLGYLDFLTRRYGTQTGDSRPLVRLLQRSLVARSLKALGYRYVQIGSWFTPTARSPIADRNAVYGGPSEFTSALYGATVLAPLVEDRGRLREWHRVQFQFEALSRVDRARGPTFVFAHFLVPHQPFVFNRDGSFVSKEMQASRPREENYVEQVLYVNDRVLELVDHLLSGPEAERPVVIVQADEGPYQGRPVGWRPRPSPLLDRKFPILNAYYLPGEGEPRPYPTITPVNSFRLVFDRYFGAGLGLLPDRNYGFRSLRRLYDFIDLTALVRASVAANAGPDAGGG